MSLFPFGVLLIVLIAFSTQVMAAAPSVGFGGAVNISNSGDRSRWPSVAMDGAGKAHVTWLQQADVNNPGRIMYSHNMGGSFSSPVEILRGAPSGDHSTSIAVEGSRVHIVASADDFYVTHVVMNINNGQATKGATTRLSGRKATSSATAVDTAGRVHAVWISNQSGNYQVYHRIWANGNWEGGSRIVRSSGSLQKFPSLVATRDGRVHVGFRNGDPVGSFFYLEWDGSNWQDSGDPPAGSNNDFVYLASDGNNLHAVWEDSDSHKISYARRVNGGWSGRTELPGQRNYNNQPTVFGNPDKGTAYAVWSAGSASGRREEVLVVEIAPDGGRSDAVRLDGGFPEGSRGAAGGGQIGIVWQDKNSSDVKFAGAIYETPQPTATPVPPTPVPDPCANDTTVEAVVVTRNPNLEGIVNAPEVPASPASELAATVRYVGATGYTPDAFFHLRVSPEQLECSGLDTYTLTFEKVPEGATPLQPQAVSIASKSPLGWLEFLASGSTPAVEGAYEYSITVQDKKGNTRRFPEQGKNFKIVYDRVGPSLSLGATNTAPTTGGGTGVPVLNLTGLVISDEGYGTFGESPDYWGYWVLIKPAGAGTPSEQEWLDYGAPLGGTLGTSLRWNMRGGLVPPFTPGATYTLYLRALDGAGNPSTQVIASQPFQVVTSEGPRILLPIYTR